MDSTQESDRLRDLYLTGVKPNGKDIGVGSYGKVFEVECFGKVYAAKEIHFTLVHGVRFEEFRAIKKAFLTECIRSGSLSHQNIVHFLGIYNPGGQSLLPVLVMERMHESLTSVVEKYLNIPIYAKLSMLLDVSQGLWYLHGHHPPIIHRDLSPNNILLTSQFVAKISDLGVAKVIQADSKNTKTRAPGTVDFMPPEAFLKTPNYGPPLDVFSYGGVILHVVNQEWPEPLHYVMTNPKSGKMIALSEVERRQEHMEKMAETPEELRALVKQCLDNQPSSRPSISDVSERVKRMREVENWRRPHVNMSPITWEELEQTTKMLKEVTITAPTAAMQIDSQAEIYRKSIKWEELAPLRVGCNARTAVLLGGVVYVGGGFEGSTTNNHDSDCIDVYNLAINQWSLYPITTPYNAFAMAVIDDKLVIAGGATENDEVVNKVLILNAGQWIDYSEMPTARSDATAVGHHSTLIVVGGAIKMEGTWTIVSTTELLDANNGIWYTCNNLPSPHQQMKVAIMNDKLYLLGGVDKDIKPCPQVFVASLDTLSTHQLNWQSAPNTPWCCSAPVVLYNKFLLTVGGEQESITSRICIFNPSAEQWYYLTDIPEARSGAAVVGVADNILVLGGVAINYFESDYSNTAWLGMFK